MKNRTKAAICSTVSVLTLSMMSTSVVMAADSSRCGGKNVAVANVSSELLIRESADDNSAVIGYVPSAGGVIVKSMDSDWTKVEVGNKTGYVKTEYLAFDEKADELKNVYGVQGAVAAWDDVKIFSDHEDTSSVIGSMDEGEGYEILGSTDNWVEIQLDDGNMAYVAAEDVETTMVVDGAVSVDASTSQTTYSALAEDSTYTDSSEYDNTAETEYYAPETEYTAEDNTYYTEETEYYAPETDYDTEETEYYAPETEYTVEDNTYYTEETEYTASETDYYTEETEYITPETEYTAPETEYTEPETEYTEPATDSTEDTSSNISSSDLDLLAALIYCEAGNQPMEGKVAVGQVVMNRVASSSFANSIHDVIYESGQFTPAYSGWLDSVLGSVPSDCYDAAIAAMNGEGTVGGALYFNTGSGKGTKIGDHQFY